MNKRKEQQIKQEERVKREPQMKPGDWWDTLKFIVTINKSPDFKPAKSIKSSGDAGRVKLTKAQKKRKRMYARYKPLNFVEI